MRVERTNRAVVVRRSVVDGLSENSDDQDLYRLSKSRGEEEKKDNGT